MPVLVISGPTEAVRAILSGESEYPLEGCTVCEMSTVPSGDVDWARIEVRAIQQFAPHLGFDPDWHGLGEEIRPRPGWAKGPIHARGTHGEVFVFLQKEAAPPTLREKEFLSVYSYHGRKIEFVDFD